MLYSFTVMSNNVNVLLFFYVRKRQPVGSHEASLSRGNLFTKLVNRTEYECLEGNDVIPPEFPVRV